MQNPTRRQYLKGLVALGDAAAGAAAGLDGLSAEETTATRCQVDENQSCFQRLRSL